MLITKKKKPVIVTIHGFGKKLSAEFDPLAAFLKKKKYEVIQFDLYNLYDEEDTDYLEWVLRAEMKMKEVMSNHDEVILIGFSMGGVIASYLATIFPVKCLILSAPAFQYLDLAKITTAGVNKIKQVSKKEESVPSSRHTKAFTELVAAYKEFINEVTCPVLLLHGTEDEVIPIESSRKAFQKLKGPKAMVLIEGGKHRMLYDNTVEKVCFAVILEMIQGNLL